jgi:hypothetical protein
MKAYARLCAYLARNLPVTREIFIWAKKKKMLPTNGNKNEINPCAVHFSASFTIF